MKKIIAGAFAIGVLLAMGAITGANAHTVWEEEPVTQFTSVSYTTYEPTCYSYSPVTYTSYSRSDCDSYYVDTVSCASDDFEPVPFFRTFNRSVRGY